MRILNKGFNFSQDGPGNRLVYHLQGCNFFCRWCSNPESVPLENPAARDVSVEDVCSEIKRSEPMFFSGGGVTFTGGEPTLQLHELKAVLEFCRSEGIHTAVETNGSNPKLSSVAHLIDWLIMDIKLTDDAEHIRMTGFSNKNTIENFLRLTKAEKELHIRIPLINNINTDPEPFVELFNSADKALFDVEILPYHEYGKCKWTSEYQIKDGFVPEEKLKAFSARLLSEGVKLVKT